MLSLTNRICHDDLGLAQMSVADIMSATEILQRTKQMYLHTFEKAHEAAIAMGLHAVKNPNTFQYELRAIFGEPDRSVVGYQARVLDLNGFNKGALGKGGEIGS